MVFTLLVISFQAKTMSARLDQFSRLLKALDGIKHDNVELVRSALRQTFSDPQQRVEAAGFGGAPFSYANAVR